MKNSAWQSYSFKIIHVVHNAIEHEQVLVFNFQKFSAVSILRVSTTTSEMQLVKKSHLILAPLFFLPMPRSRSRKPVIYYSCSNFGSACYFFENVKLMKEWCALLLLVLLPWFGIYTLNFALMNGCALGTRSPGNAESRDSFAVLCSSFNAQAGSRWWSEALGKRQPKVSAKVIWAAVQRTLVTQTLLHISQ